MLIIRLLMMPTAFWSNNSNSKDFIITSKLPAVTKTKYLHLVSSLLLNQISIRRKIKEKNHTIYDCFDFFINSIFYEYCYGYCYCI